MAERSFAREVESLRLGAGEVFRGEGILAVTKALLQSGVAYVGGYQGAPISHLMDVFADAGEILDELGVHFQASSSEAAAAAMLAASINYPLRGAVTWKSTVGTNVASDALSNLASAGVQGGTLIVLGEDYGEGASIMQERTHAFAMKSQIWLLDPRPDLTVITDAVEHGFGLSECSNTPVMLELRIRACHMYGSFVARDNVRPPLAPRDALLQPSRSAERIILPPFTFQQEQDKIRRRWPAAVRYIRAHALNEIFDGDIGEVGIIAQGGMYNFVARALEILGLADAFGNSRIPLYVLNVTYPLVDEEIEGFCVGKRAVLMVEEGQPDYIEQALHQVLDRAGSPTRVAGKGFLPRAGEYTGAVILEGLRGFLAEHAPEALAGAGPASDREGPAPPAEQESAAALQAAVPPRPPGLCTGCPERPFFTAVKLLEREMGPVHISADIGCHSFATLPPFNLGNSILGYGLGPAAASAFGGSEQRPALTIMGDGGFWHNGLTSGVTNAVFNRDDSVIVVVDNNYSAATGGQYIPSSRAGMAAEAPRYSIQEAAKGVGVRWVRTVRTYDIEQSLATLREAMTTHTPGPRVIVAEGECQLNRQRRIRPQIAARLRRQERVVQERFGVDSDTCTGDHACIRLSGCPSLTIKPNPDPLRDHPVAWVDNNCVGCGVCGSVAHAAALCPSFYRAEIISNPTWWDRARARARGAVIGTLQRRAERRRAARRYSTGDPVPGPYPELDPHRDPDADSIADFGANPAPSATHPTPGADPESFATLPTPRADALDGSGPSEPTPHALTIAISAMGGQGGGVLSRWLVEVAERSGYLAQATSVPGVAQRTGATIYYIELFPAAAAEAADAHPVLALMPIPGHVDLVVAAELVEAGRAVVRGLVTPDRTTLVASSHREYSVVEKSALGDGTADSGTILDGLADAARHSIMFDMAAPAAATGSVISSVLLGAVAGSGRLPFARQQFEAAIRRSGIGGDSSLAGFASGFDGAVETLRQGGLHGSLDDSLDNRDGASTDPAVPDGDAAGLATAGRGPAAQGAEGGGADPHRVRRRIEERFEEADCREIVLEGARRAADYLDADYALEYLDRLEAFHVADAGDGALTRAAARHLALWMTYEDAPRVADLKTRAARFERIRDEVCAKPGQFVVAVDFLHPSVQELCDILPARLGAFILGRPRLRGWIDRRINRGRQIPTGRLGGFLMLHAVAGLRRLRRRSYRFAVEKQRIDAWLDRALEAAANDRDLAVEIVRCQRLIKGYGDTHARGMRGFQAIMAVLPMASRMPDAAETVRALSEAALADDSGEALQRQLVCLDRGAPPEAAAIN